MPLLVNKADNDDPNLQLGTIPASTTGVFTFKVQNDSKTQLVITNAGGSTYDLVHYVTSEEIAKRAGVSRGLSVDVEALTDVSKGYTGSPGMDEVGIRVTTATASEMQLEVREEKS